MAISSPGIGSGLNIQSIVSQLVAVESQPVQLLQQKSSALQTKLSVFGQVKSELSAVQDAASALMDASTWDSKTFTSSNTSTVTGTATSSALASSFSVEVSSLASGQSLKTGAVSSSYTAPASGTLSIQLGQWDANGNFSSAASSAVSVNVTAGDSLTTIAANFNAQNTTAGVSATVITAGGMQQLLLRGNSTGAVSGFQINASSGLETFGFTATPAVLDAGGAVTTPAVYNGMTRTQTATDAALTIDGIAVTSATNTVTDAVPGVTLNLVAKTTTPTQITLGVDKDAIKTKIQAFQDAYNKLNADLKTQTAYDPVKKSGGPLLGDSTTAGLQTMLRSLVGASGPSTSTLSRLSDLGLQIQADGSLKTNSTKLDAALQDTANAKAFFSAASATATGDGIARRIYNFVFAANAVGGSISTHSDGFQKAIDQNSKSIEKFNTHIADYQKQLLARYTQLDASMSTLNSLSTFVSAQVAQWNKTG
jgi:flagellar hook-associated protein 2